MATALNTYHGAAAITHTIDLGTPTASTDIFVAVSTAAGLPAAPGDWIREGYLAGDSVAGLYRLPAADNDGSTTELQLSLTGARQLAAVIWEDTPATAITLHSGTSGYATSDTAVTDAITAAEVDVAVAVVAATNTATGTAVPQDVSSWSGSFSALSDSGAPSDGTDEDPRVYVATDADHAFTAEVVTLTFAASWEHAFGWFVITYDLVAGSPTATTTDLSASPLSPDSDTDVTLLANVTPPAAVGSVTFYDGVAELGTVAVASGSAELPAREFSAGTHVLTAVFDGTDGVWEDSQDDIEVDVLPAGSPNSLVVYPTVRQVLGGTTYRVLTELDDPDAPVGSYEPWQFHVSDYGAVGDGVTDDTAALQAAINAAVTYASGTGERVAEVLFDDVEYLLSTAIADTTVTGGGQRAQLRLPHIDTSSAPITLRLRGATSPPIVPSPDSAALQLAGTVLRSTLTGQAEGVVNGLTVPPSIVGAPRYAAEWDPYEAAAVVATTSSNIHIEVEDLTVVAPWEPSLAALDLAGAASARLKGVACRAYASRQTIVADNFTDFNYHAPGVFTPMETKRGKATIESLLVEGFLSAVNTNGSTVIDELVASVCAWAVRFGIFPSDAATHSVRTILHDGYYEGYYVDDPVSPVGDELLVINIEQLRMTDEDPWGAGGTPDHISDVLNTARGTVAVANLDDPDTLDVEGAAQTRVLNALQSVGVVTAPSVPASTTPLQNPFWRDAIVVINGGAVSDIHIDGMNLGVTASAVLVPTGSEITLTYTTAPTWTWMLV